jgi:putative effector of murein hydrolase LrgA (UPF0299 family)
MKEFIDDHFNVLLVSSLLLLFMWFTLHILHHGDAPAVQWIENLTGQFASTLFTLLVVKKVVDGKNGKPPTEPPKP